MKKLALLIGCIIPMLSFAGNGGYSSDSMMVYQEQCAKEKDPVKRQNSCYLLDQFSKSQEFIPDLHQEMATV